jgi:hypothetical protein
MSRIFYPGTYRIMPLHKWSDQNLCRLVEQFETIGTTDKRGRRVTRVKVRFSSRTEALNRVAALMGA